MKTATQSRRFAAALAAITLCFCFVGSSAEAREDRVPKILGPRMGALTADCDKAADKAVCEKKKAAASVCDEAFFAEMEEATASDRAYYEAKCGGKSGSRRAKSGTDISGEKSVERRVRCFKEQLGSVCSVDPKSKRAVCINNWQAVDLTPYSSHNAWTLCVPHDRIDCNLASIESSMKKMEEEKKSALAAFEKEQANKAERAKFIARLERKVEKLDEKIAKLTEEQEKCSTAIAAVKAGALVAMKAESKVEPTAGASPASSIPPAAVANAQVELASAKSLNDVRTIMDALADQVKELRTRMARAEERLNKGDRKDAEQDFRLDGLEGRIQKQEARAFSFRPSKFHLDGCFSSVIGIGPVQSALGGGICPEFDWQLASPRLAAFLGGVIGGGQVMGVRNVFMLQLDFGLKTHLTDWLDLRTSFFGRVLPMPGGQLLADGRTADIMAWHLGLALGLGVSLGHFDFFVEGDFGGGQSTWLILNVPQVGAPPRDEYRHGMTWLPGIKAGIGVNF